MMQKTTFPPDLLQRFAAAPYIFKVFRGEQYACVQSNDLEVALSVRRSCVLYSKKTQPDVRFWKLIRDRAAPSGRSSEVLIVADGPLLTLHAGTGTLLIYDRDKSEFLGFLAEEVSTEYLVNNLIPALTSM